MKNRSGPWKMGAKAWITEGRASKHDILGHDCKGKNKRPPTTFGGNKHRRKIAFKRLTYIAT